MCSQSETPLASRGRGVITIGSMHINPIASLIPVKKKKKDDWYIKWKEKTSPRFQV